MTRIKRLSEQEVLEIQELRKSGESLLKLATRFGVTKASISYWTNPAVREKRLKHGVKYRADNRDHMLELYATYRRENRGEMLEKKVQYREKNGDRIRADARRRYAENIEFERARNRAYDAKHREERRAKARKRYAASREKHLARRKQWARDNPEKERARVARRRARQRESSHEITEEQRRAIEQIYRTAIGDEPVRCYLCGTLIPQGKRHVDHVVPLFRGGVHLSENLEIACSTCNHCKGTHLLEELDLPWGNN